MHIYLCMIISNSVKFNSNPNSILAELTFTNLIL
jgi:hypothetical protein